MTNIDLNSVLQSLVECAIAQDTSFVSNEDLRSDINTICRDIRVKAPIRLLLSSCAAKFDNPDIDVRKPYTAIGSADSFSGRTYDERYISVIIIDYELPCNSSTAFLTPAFRNGSETLRLGLDLVGRNPELYRKTLSVLNEVYEDNITAEILFKEVIRILLEIRNEAADRIKQHLEELKTDKDILSLSSEQIIGLLTQHLHCRYSSRLPVLIVAAAYCCIADLVGENIKNLNAHNAADNQTGALGDVEVTLVDEDNVVTSYEMKAKQVIKSDIDSALKKIAKSSHKIDNYIFITTDTITPEVCEYADSLYNLSGVEITILDCIGFIRHFLHFFHRRRTEFLEKYQEYVLNEADSAVNQPLKEAFLTMRKAAEVDS